MRASLHYTSHVFSTMERKHDRFTPKLTLFLVLHIVTLFTANHAFKLDQPGTLLSRRLAKLKTPVTSSTRNQTMWEETKLVDKIRAFDTGNMENDVVTELPGQPWGVMFKQYAGYVNVDESRGRSLFYYFAEAAESPSSKPLILWLNGGPGCSSFGLGAMAELGPFGVNPDGKTLYSRKFAWNKVANTLFLESPAGVGFSYSNTTSDYSKSNDARTAEDAYTFLINWFARFPQYKATDFYIIGESYAGFYIPELADVILKRNSRAESTYRIQLKGIMIGNGIMNDETDTKGFVDFLWSHALISDETHLKLSKCLAGTSSCNGIPLGEEVGDIDPYNIYGPLCSKSSKKRKCPEYDPCENSYIHSYLNLPQLQEAIHANTTKLPYPWNLCSDVVDYTGTESTMFPIYERLVASQLRILLYSGDADAVVPVTGTQYSINAMNLSVIKSWRPWLDDTNEVGGYRVVYDGLTFATVRGAGHQVPQIQPGRALTLFNMFLTNTF